MALEINSVLLLLALVLLALGGTAVILYIMRLARGRRKSGAGGSEQT